MNKEKNSNFKETFTLTFGDQGENHVGMQKIGTPLKYGLSVEEVENIDLYAKSKGYLTELIRLHDMIDIKVPEAVILIIRKGLKLFDVDPDSFYQEQLELKKDKHAKMYGRVVQKHARHNLCFSDFHQDADYEKGKGTVYAFNEVPLLQKVRVKLGELNNKLQNLVAEGNYYFSDKCGLSTVAFKYRKITNRFKD